MFLRIFVKTTKGCKIRVKDHVEIFEIENTSLFQAMVKLAQIVTNVQEVDFTALCPLLVKINSEDTHVVILAVSASKVEPSLMNV